MPSETARVALYVRVSTDQQTIKNQERELQAVAERHGWQVVAVFKDQGISGAKGRDGRPGLDKLLQAVARKEVDMVAAWSVDRLGRSLQDLVRHSAGTARQGRRPVFCISKVSTRPRRPAARCFRCWACSPSSSAP